MTFRPDTCWKDMTRKASFSRFMAVFMSYCPHFGVPWQFAWSIRTLTCLRDMSRNSSFSLFMVVCMSYCPQFWGSKVIYSDLKTCYMFEIYDQKLVVFEFNGCFHELLPTDFGVPGRFTKTLRPNTCWRDMTEDS